MSHGPLCDEPIQGVGVILEDFVQAPQPDTDSTHYLYGQLISAVRQTIRASLQVFLYIIYIFTQLQFVVWCYIQHSGIETVLLEASVHLTLYIS